MNSKFVILKSRERFDNISSMEVFSRMTGDNAVAAVYGDHRFRVNRFAVSISGKGRKRERTGFCAFLLSTVFLMPRAKRMYDRVNSVASGVH